ncbi:MAG: nucleoside triphosphate pyrophosphohydrolase [Clostridia bacterium]|nr:nucleoside triphosphate pyrophosphohydrolase [Clostridia bacterium]
MIEVVEMGSELGLMQLRAVEALRSADTVVLQTLRPAAAKDIAALAREVSSLDPLFETAADFPALYLRGAEQILESSGKVVFCCLGPPAENGFVKELRARTEVLFLGGSDPVREALMLAGDGEPAASYTVTGARDLEGRPLDTSRTLVVTGVDDAYQAQGAKLALGEYYPDDTLVCVVSGAGAEHLPLSELDRRESWGSGAVLVLPPLRLMEKVRFTYHDLLGVMQRLRAPGGCPWDAEQTHESLAPHLIEESYEVADAVADSDMQALLDELGDVLLQVVFHAEIGRLAGEFNEMDVTTAVTDKMIRRHPHVFGTVEVSGSREVLSNWDAIKREEKGAETLTQTLRDVPSGMGSLLRAEKIQKKAANVGFDWPDWHGALDKVREETAELAEALSGSDRASQEEEAGDLLFAVVNLVRLAGFSPETVLRAACRKFIRRFGFMEAHAARPLPDLSLDELDALWEAAKEE